MKTKKIKVEPITNVITNIKSIDALWGINTSKYRGKDLQEYTNYISQLTNFGLENHARELNLTYLLDRQSIIDELIKLYKKDTNSRNIPKDKNIQSI
jgi:hypothetical protein